MTLACREYFRMFSNVLESGFHQLLLWPFSILTSVHFPQFLADHPFKNDQKCRWISLKCRWKFEIHRILWNWIDFTIFYKILKWKFIGQSSLSFHIGRLLSIIFVSFSNLISFIFVSFSTLTKSPLFEHFFLLR
jgi:hypothetical protein